MAKADQLLTVLWLLRSRSRMTAEQIAEQLETSVRTVYRYIDALCMSGVPVEAEPGHGGGYRLPPTFREAPLFFSIDELKAMVHAGRFAEQAGYPYIEPLRQATGKMQSRLSEEQMEQLQRHTAGFEVMQPSARQTDERTLQELEQSVAAGRTVTIRYGKPDGSEPEERKVNPYGLVHRMFRWYLIGHCHLRDDMRIFRADRIDGVRQTDDTFTRPASFSLRDFVKERFESGPETADGETLLTIRLQGEEHAISILADNWYMRSRITAQSATELTFTLDEATMNGFIPRYLLSFGTQVRIMEPLELRRQVAELARELAEFHGD
ncbi:helix-turn-helix transcriptional regulator [Paenibacillus ginsengarvi]|uniref:YafY family transcriptional regulator n=1 Tax=Paenibacillus ginsengarvi TaxID=400777 RepID=A0A3B0CC96_9BACL|nr:YafY family protein [Paenibacillus ginsengarvi]RKN80586.1 YafY family transcriptional regulator [Paenibacillus ginsengarvi]